MQYMQKLFEFLYLTAILFLLIIAQQNISHFIAQNCTQIEKTLPFEVQYICASTPREAEPAHHQVYYASVQKTEVCGNQQSAAARITYDSFGATEQVKPLFCCDFFLTLCYPAQRLMPARRCIAAGYKFRKQKKRIFIYISTYVCMCACAHIKIFHYNSLRFNLCEGQVRAFVLSLRKYLTEK